MNVFNRAAMIVVAALMIVAGAFVFSQAYGWPALTALEPFPWLLQLGQFLREQPAGYVTVSGIVGALLGLVLMYLELRAPGEPTSQVILADRTGVVTVSLAGLKRLAEHVVSGIPGVEVCRAETRRRRSEVDFRCRVVLKTDASAPEVGTEVRDRLTSSILHHTGTSPGRIHIHTQVGTAPQSRRRVS